MFVFFFNNDEPTKSNESASNLDLNTAVRYELIANCRVRGTQRTRLNYSCIRNGRIVCGIRYVLCAESPRVHVVGNPRCVHQK